MRYPTGRSDVRLLVAAMIVVIMAAGPDAQRRREATPNPTLPVATDVITATPDAYYGKVVTISAGVEQVLSKTAFTIDQKRVLEGGKEVKSLGKPILVIAPTLNGALDRKNYMLFVGELLKFDAAAIRQKAKDYKLDLSPDLIASYQNRPVLLATAVIDSQYVDQAKRPLSAEEVALSAIMKRINPAATALRRGIDASDRTVVSESASTLKQAFIQSGPFWKERPDATLWATEARQYAEAIEANAIAGKWDGVTVAADMLTKRCQSCHGVYRERLDDGTFRIKSGK